MPVALGICYVFIEHIPIRDISTTKEIAIVYKALDIWIRSLVQMLNCKNICIFFLDNFKVKVLKQLSFLDIE